MGGYSGRWGLSSSRVGPRVFPGGWLWRCSLFRGFHWSVRVPGGGSPPCLPSVALLLAIASIIFGSLLAGACQSYLRGRGLVFVSQSRVSRQRLSLCTLGPTRRRSVFPSASVHIYMDWWSGAGSQVILSSLWNGSQQGHFTPRRERSLRQLWVLS